MLCVFCRDIPGNACLATSARSVPMTSLRSLPCSLPTPSAIRSPSSPSIHRTGAVRNVSSAEEIFEGSRSRTLRTAESSTGFIPHSKSSSPPNFFGMLAMSINAESVGNTSWEDSMKIFEVVIGSNHFLIHPHTVGKNEGAPIIYHSTSRSDLSYYHQRADLQISGLAFLGNGR